MAKKDITLRDAKNIVRRGGHTPRDPKYTPRRRQNRPTEQPWLEQWKTYITDAASNPWGRGDGDCCALAGGWASLVSGQELYLPSLTDQAAETYLADMGGMEDAVRDALRPLGYRLTTDHGAYPLGIITYQLDTPGSADHPAIGAPTFPIGVGVIVGERIATRAEHRTGVSYLHPFRVRVLSVYNHPNIVKKWASASASPSS